MATTTVNNKRIAKNTLLLYFRMILIMGVSLYTSRIVLNTLGVEDYGIYNVVGGIVIVLSFLNGAMAGATQRYLNIELGRKDYEKLKKVFTTSLLIHFGVALVIVLLAETVGVWFLSTQMNITPDRMYAAHWVYQFSIAAFIVSVISVPYNATIIAHEKMSAFAYISILEAVLKLVIVYVLILSPFDKLILYAFLIFIVGVIIRIIYGIYCKRNFQECRIESWQVDKPLLKSMLSFSSWTILGNLSYIFHTQGIAIVMNMFFGVTVNAAQGIATQVSVVVKGVVTNFLQALNPQVVKTYAENDMESMHKLVLVGSKISYFLVAFFTIPLILEAPSVLRIWLKIVPEYAIIFVRLTLLLSLCESFASLLATAQGATGKIKNYQIILTSIGLLHLPISYLFYNLGYEPQAAMYVYLVIICVIQIVRINYVCISIKLSCWTFYSNVIIRCFGATFIGLLLPLLFHSCMKPSLMTTIFIFFVSFITFFLSAFLLGATRKEKMLLSSNIKDRISKIKIIN
ncbi:MATE family efflux transporter [Bacteroides fluxus]|uniref:Toxin secretion/phage lysis holin n=1 Tax=Bacteroides fluxus YIT 12057 TaxID=763034 RepID=F3PUK2_9BACE|nr:holin [Bacteroides fluxus]EGF56073.1 toxin secretion/phage lysis holin [Bacteroides fluxus YIT 12057]